jgi:CRISP-associated protein Cas1
MIVEYLLADCFGSHIGKYSQRLKITQNGETLAEAPLLHLQAVYIVERGVSISADAIAACCENGIPIHYMDTLGRNYASLYSSGLTGTVKTRRAQLEAYHTEKGFAFVQALTEAKIHNQASTLKYLAKTRKESQPEVYHELHLAAGDLQDCIAEILRLEAAPIESQRQLLMGIEGNAARLYWQAVRAIIPENYAWKERFGRGANDPVNSLLNYGYGILYSRVEQALTLAGLDPYAGFFHADRPGKPSLVLDMIEEFRQLAVDRVVWGLLNRQYKVEQGSDGKLSEACRRDFAEKILEHQHATFSYESKKVPLRIILQSQARQLASFLRGDKDCYTAFKGSY